MDSVRFSIIENDLNWEKQQQTQTINELNDDDDDDCKTISSEDSDGGNTMPPVNQQQAHRDEQEIYSATEVEITLRNLTNADKVQEIIISNEFSNIFETQQNANTALLFAVWYGQHNYVAKLLADYNADPNTVDMVGRTALHLACTIGNLAITKILLRHDCKVHVWDNSKKATPLHCAASSGNVECVQLLLKNGAQLNAGIERKSALHYAVQKNAVKCVQVLLKYGANPNTPQVYTETPLHIAAASGYADCIKALLEYDADVRSQVGRKKSTALHLTVEDDYCDCVRLLLEAGANIDARNSDDQTPLHVACLSQSVETVELLIKMGADIHSIYKDGRTCLHASIVKESRFWDCAKLLLQAKVDVNRADNFGYTPLHIAALNEFGSCVWLLIDHGADITARTKGGVLALTFICRRTPEVIPKYCAKFDSSIKVNEHEIGDVDCEIKLDFRVLVPNLERGETELLLAFIDVGQKRVLKHPLCETFLYLKWRRIRKFFLFSLFYHGLFVLLFTVYVLGVYVKDCPHQDRPTMKETCTPASYVTPVGQLVIFLNSILLTKEVFQMAHGISTYFKYWENWLQWSIIFGVFLCASPHQLLLNDLSLIPVWQQHATAIVIFFVWLELMMLVGRFPIFGLYVQMFTTVAVNFSKFLMAYCCLLIAFGLSFAVLFSNNIAFQYVPWTLLKTIVMMAGELEFEDIFYSDTEVEYPVTAHIMFLAFVILITVILTNLLVGLAVSDIQGLQASAGLDRLSRQAELISRLEGLMFSKLLRKAPYKLLLLFQKNALLRTSRCHLQFCIKPNDPREKRIPKDLMVAIYKLVAERRDRNQSIKRKRNHQHFHNAYKAKIDGTQVEYRNNLALRNLRNSRPGSENTAAMYDLLMTSGGNSIVGASASKAVENNVQFMRKQMSDMETKLNAMQADLNGQLKDISNKLSMLNNM